MNEYNQKQVDRFFSDIADWSSAYQQICVSYIAFLKDGEFRLTKARLFLETWPREIELETYQFKNLQAQVFRLSELEVSPKQFLEKLMTGIFPAPHSEIKFLPKDNQGYSAYYDPLVDEGFNEKYRLSLLSISGDRLDNTLHQRELDWELKSGTKPFDNLNALLLALNLGPINYDRTEVEFVAFNCLRPIYEPLSNSVSGSNAKASALLAKGLETSKVGLGYQLFHQGKVIIRDRLEGNSLDWVTTDEGYVGTAKLEVPEGAVLQFFGSYAGSLQHEWWVTDPSTVQNPLRAIYGTVDQDLDVLSDFLSRGPGRGNARDLEAGMAWLLWMLGFRVIHLGATPKLQEAPDLVATTPIGHFLVIECTTDLLKTENKLPKLISRTQSLRNSLDASGNHNLKTLAVIVSSKTRKEVAADIEQAEKLGVLVITRDELLKSIDRTQVYPDLETIFRDAEKLIEDAKSKHSARRII